ncbi:MAG: hypothetical protein KIH62_004055 [Candidatus Kerfeldbacteria bacterium]|nr:hypothetical protein [Candidatus Kerfeldbacteria bacterium]
MKEEALRAVAHELDLNVQSIDGDYAVVDFPQAHTIGELCVEETSTTHPLFDEYKVQERVFRVMKDFRFFQLCLPAVYGMGCVDDKWDWVLRKRYTGETYAHAPYPQTLAREMAVLVFDLSQVPVLKFKKDVVSVNYTEQAPEFADFFARSVPTLYCITNGACIPESLIHLEESIVLNNWTNARIVALEEIVAELILHVYPDTVWLDMFMRELSNYVDVNSEWLEYMLLCCASRNGKVDAAQKCIQQYVKK